jgi:hypothetical protein
MNVKMSEERIEIDSEGKVKNFVSNKTISWGTEPSFIKLYLQDLLYLSDIPRGYDRILYALLKKMSYAGGDQNGMEVIVNASLKRRIAEELQLKNVGSISNAITDLVKGGVLIRKDVGIYQFNPYLFGKGDWQDVSQLRLEVDYSDISGGEINGKMRTFKTVCEYKDSISKVVAAANKRSSDAKKADSIADCDNICDDGIELFD